jgi:hypothetical protein
MARRKDMNNDSKNDPRMTPSNVLPGEMFDIEQFERDLAASADDEFDAWVDAHEADAAEQAPTEPPAGSWAAVARIMAQDDDSGFDWDAWKDEMKERDCA